MSANARTWPVYVQDPLSLNVYTVQARELVHEANQSEYLIDVDGNEYVRSKSQPLYWLPRSSERPAPQTLGVAEVEAPPMEPTESPEEAAAEDGTPDPYPNDNDPED